MTTQEIADLKKLLDTPTDIVIVPHKNPDGDAIGSCLALHHFLKEKGHTSYVIAPNDYPDFLKWLPGEKEVIKFDQEIDKSKKIIDKAQLIFTLDFNHFSRTGTMEETLQNASATFAMIDHHQQPDDYAEFTYSDVSCSSTCQMVYHFIEKLEETNKISSVIATCLYIGIMTDTGSFRFPSTSSTTHRVIADLIDKGAENALIHQQTFDTNSYERLQLLGVALNNLTIIEGCNTAYICLSQKELDDHQFKKGDTEGFVNYGLSVKGIIFAAIFIEHKAENIIKISLRSKGDFNVNEFAREYFEGGGHINAAGGKSDKNLQETIAYFEDIVKKHQKKLNS
ncbi:DHH family phosphoesterase [Mesonia aquimarina]|uniref:DHH family phosphoesterase n=1 Tax=Mesonia aquimarina TaxID=1504967 RepID=UPI000EF59366|nr:bifunctional oligoribonuclease/PAP phosphatase NrnA [Mesonia aquimarina]